MSAIRADRTGGGLTRLLSLLDTIGINAVPGLLAQLNADLAAASATILRAMPKDDWSSLRLASHNLTALAGTVGVSELEGLAEAMNRAAHAQDRALARQLAAAIQDQVAALIRRIAALHPDDGAP